MNKLSPIVNAVFSFFSFLLFFGVSHIADAATASVCKDASQITWKFEDGLAFPLLGRDPGNGLQFFGWLFVAAMAFAAVLALVSLAYAGLRYMAAAGNTSGQTVAKERINNSIIGLIFAMGSILILYQINPNLTTFGLPQLTSSQASQKTGLKNCGYSEGLSDALTKVQACIDSGTILTTCARLCLNIPYDPQQPDATDICLNSLGYEIPAPPATCQDLVSCTPPQNIRDQINVPKTPDSSASVACLCRPFPSQEFKALCDSFGSGYLFTVDEKLISCYGGTPPISTTDEDAWNSLCKTEIGTPQISGMRTTITCTLQ